MARRVISEEALANEIYSKFGECKIREKWRGYANSHLEDQDYFNVEDYIEKEVPELNEWLETFIPYLPNFNVLDDIIKDYFRGEFSIEEFR